MFNSKLRKKIEMLEQENYELHNAVSALLKEIERRDQTIINMQMNKIPIKQPDIDPFAFDFPGTEKSFDDFWAKFTGPKNIKS